MPAKTHGMWNTPEYKAWSHMKERCLNERCKSFSNYGGRGISVCNEWIESFAAFYRDMGPRPSTKHTLERKNNDADYRPDNCVWATRAAQQRNRRQTRWIEFEGKRLTAGDWEEKTGIPRKLIAKRIFERGWSVQRALLTPN